MESRIGKWLNKNYPQNSIIEKPDVGIVIFLALSLGFVILYKPLNLHEARFMGFELTMIAYLFALSIPVFFSIKLLKRIGYFSNPNEWTILKEVSFIAIVLSIMGIALYFYGFLFELPDSRWNLPTFFDSFKHAFLIGVIPFAIFTATNFKHLFVTDIERSYDQETGSTLQELHEQLIRIGSQLKKEELSFYPAQLVYAESDGNYVVFHLNINNKIQKKVIRNSISNIEQQLLAIPFFIRTHRAFIVNVKQVVSQKGNTLGYRLKLNGSDTVIPVSRQNIREFDHLIKQQVPARDF